MGYVWNVESGNDKAVLWQTNTGGNHFNHLHISNRSGQTSGTPDLSAINTNSSISTSSHVTSGSSPTPEKVPSETEKQASSILSGIYTQALGLDKLKDASILGALEEEIKKFKKLIK